MHSNGKLFQGMQGQAHTPQHSTSAGKSITDDDGSIPTEQVHDSKTIQCDGTLKVDCNQSSNYSDNHEDSSVDNGRKKLLGCEKLRHQPDQK